MQYRILLLLALCMCFTSVLNAREDSMDDTVVSSSIRRPMGYQELKNLKDIHRCNEIFDNYHLGGISCEPIEKGQ
mgnify:CR=1 FL=1